MNKKMESVILLGRTNVGKSQLFNRLVNKNISIVFDQNNTTVDVIEYIRDGIIFYDTAGINSIKDFEHPLIYKLITKSKIILYIIDKTVGILDIDRINLNYLRKHNSTVWLIANKSELKNTCNISDNNCYYISAKENIDVNFLYTNIIAQVNIENITQNPKPSIAIIGRCNSGKSTLLNKIVGYDRSKVSSIAGMTRDPVIIESDKYKFIDTAGYTNIKNIFNYTISCLRHRILLDASGVVLLLDGAVGLTHLDKKLIFEGSRYGKFMIIAINKSDIIEPHIFESFKRANIPDWIPVIQISALKGSLSKLFNLIDIAYNNSFKRITTGLLNSFLLDAKKQYPFLSKIKYICQTNINPIKLCYFGHKKMDDNHELLLKKIFANYFKLIGVKILLQYNKKNSI